MKVFLAGIGVNEDVIKLAKEVKPIFLLESFFYLNKLKADVLNDYMNFIKKDAKDFILDSGAFTMLNNSKDNFLDKLDEYVDKYINFINEYDVEHFIELDIDKLIGYEKVKLIREKIEKETNKKCIPVWHLSRGIEEYKKLCKDYSYIALGGIAIKDIKRKDYDKMFPYLLRIAKQHNCNVHGLGLTSSKINKFNFYSVDSTSWTVTQRFGEIQKYDYKTNTIKRLKKDYARIKADKTIRNKLNLLCLKEWKKLQVLSLKK